MQNADDFWPALPPADGALEDLALELATAVTGLGVRLHPVLRASVADLVRRVNCFYSHQLAGHDLDRSEIDRALAGELSPEPERRRRQLEALAHVHVQRAIDLGEDPPMPPASAVYLEWLCRRLHVTRPVTSAESSNGEFGRTEALQPFEVAFDIPGRFRGVVATGAAYHRLLHLRPFPDGNGRIGRLMVYALLARLGVRPDLWPLSRGLARRREEYDAQVDRKSVV